MHALDVVSPFLAFVTIFAGDEIALAQSMPHAHCHILAGKTIPSSLLSFVDTCYRSAGTGQTRVSVFGTGGEIESGVE